MDLTLFQTSGDCANSVLDAYMVDMPTHNHSSIVSYKHVQLLLLGDEIFPPWPTRSMVRITSNSYFLITPTWSSLYRSCNVSTTDSFCCICASRTHLVIGLVDCCKRSKYTHVSWIISLPIALQAIIAIVSQLCVVDLYKLRETKRSYSFFLRRISLSKPQSSRYMSLSL